jgi:hypothetical protein
VSTVAHLRTHAGPAAARMAAYSVSMSLQVSRDNRISPKTRPSARTADVILRAADRVVTTVVGASSISPLSTA